MKIGQPSWCLNKKSPRWSVDHHQHHVGLWVGWSNCQLTKKRTYGQNPRCFTNRERNNSKMNRKMTNQWKWFLYIAVYIVVQYNFYIFIIYNKQYKMCAAKIPLRNYMLPVEIYVWSVRANILSHEFNGVGEGVVGLEGLLKGGLAPSWRSSCHHIISACWHSLQFCWEWELESTRFVDSVDSILTVPCWMCLMMLYRSNNLLTILHPSFSLDCIHAGV